MHRNESHRDCRISSTQCMLALAFCSHNAISHTEGHINDNNNINSDLTYYATLCVGLYNNNDNIRIKKYIYIYLYIIIHLFRSTMYFLFCIHFECCRMESTIVRIM